jgi:phosphatidylinositol alpha-mannosyltransferase
MSAGVVPPRAAVRLYRALFGGSLARARAVIALSGWASECHREFFPPPHAIVPPGIDLDRFAPGVEPLPSGLAAPKVLFVGRLDARKGLEVLLAAWPKVLEAVPDARLVVVGDGPRAGAAREQVAALGIGPAVRFAGQVSREDLPRYYAGAAAYVSPALGGESFGIVLLEAMASGAPVIASRIRGYDEVVGPDDGLLVQPGDPRALAGAITQVLVDTRLAARLAAAGRARAAAFAWPQIARQTLQVYARARTRTSS